MKSKLIYHSEGKDGVTSSPFDNAIRDILIEENIKIACPYISVDYVQGILSQSGNWQILTDMEVWIDSYKRYPKSLNRIYDFIVANNVRIHHFRYLHAKVIITSTGVIMGSANLTENGIRRNEEVSVLIKDSKQIAELDEWFIKLWNRSDVLDITEINKVDKYIKSLSAMKENKPTPGLNLKLPRRENPIDRIITDHEFKTLCLSTVNDITNRFKEKMSIKNKSIRHSIYQMIKGGQICVYKYKDIDLIDDEGERILREHWGQIGVGRKNKFFPSSRRIFYIPDDFFLTIKDISLKTGISEGKIREMIKKGSIQPKFKDRMYIFDVSVVDDINNLPVAPTGQRDGIQHKNKEPVWLTSYKPLEEFVLESRQQQPNLSDQQLIDMARNDGIEGVTEKSGRELARQNYDRAITKRKLFKEFNLTSEKVKLMKTQRVRITELRKGSLHNN